MSEAAILLRLNQKYEELRRQYDLLCENIQCLAEAYQIEAGDPLIKLQRKRGIDKQRNERTVIEQEMFVVELQIKKLRINAVYHALLNLDCIEHINKFAEFVPSHPVGAFVIHGYSKYGLKILIKRILQAISFTPPSPIRIDWTSIQRIYSFGAYSSNSDVNPLWGDLSRRLNCSPLPEQIALKISQKLQKENVVIILDSTDITCDFNIIIDDFWSNLIQTIQNSSGKSANLLLFMILIGDSDYLNDCGFHFAEAHDDSWQPRIPVKLPCVDKYCADDLKAWMNHVSGIFPLGKRRNPGIINDILENTQNGLSDHVIQYICTDLCECEFDGEMLLKWLNY